MWSELYASRQRRAALLGVIAEYCVYGAESEFSTSARVERFVSEREAFMQTLPSVLLTLMVCVWSETPQPF